MPMGERFFVFFDSSKCLDPDKSSIYDFACRNGARKYPAFGRSSKLVYSHLNIDISRKYLNLLDRMTNLDRLSF